MRKLDAISKKLYRELLRRSSAIDAHPACKAFIHYPRDQGAPSSTSDGFTEALSAFLSGRHLYLPKPKPRSLTDVVRRSFRFPHELVDSDTAFEGLRFMNSILRVAEEKELIDERAARSPYLLRLLRNNANDNSSLGDIGTSDAMSDPQPSSLQASASFAKGTVLIAHPMQGGFFTRSAILLLRHDQYGTAGVCLNAPLNLRLLALWNAKSPFADQIDGNEGTTRADDTGAAEKDGVANGSDGGQEAEEMKRAMGDTMQHYCRKWVSLGGPVPGPDSNLTLLHSSPLLRDSSDCVMMADDAASTSWAAAKDPTSTTGDKSSDGSAGIWVSLKPKECMREAKAAGVSVDCIRLFAGMCVWRPGQLADEVAQGIWVTAQGPAEVLDVMERGCSSVEDDRERNSMRWCVEYRHKEWSRVMKLLGGEHAAFATIPADAAQL